jgi:uncharacterized protein (DUF983 family)
MDAALIVGAVAAGIGLTALYTAWMNGVFARCPHCGKIGSWRYDSAGPAVEEKDKDGAVERARQVRVCRGCGKKVLDKWSDDEGRTFEKAR